MGIVPALGSFILLLASAAFFFSYLHVSALCVGFYLPFSSSIINVFLYSAACPSWANYLTHQNLFFVCIHLSIYPPCTARNNHPVPA